MRLALVKLNNHDGAREWEKMKDDGGNAGAYLKDDVKKIF